MKSEKAYSLKLNTVLNSFRMLLTVVSPLITFPYISRIFNADGIGAINYTQSIANIFILIGSLGIYTYGVREGSNIKDDYYKFSSLVSELLLVNLFSTLFSYVIFFLCVFHIQSLKSYEELLLINSISIFFTSLGVDWIFGVYEDYKYITLRQILSQITLLACMFVFVKTKDDVRLWVAINVFCNAVCNICNWISGKKYFRLIFSKVTIHRVLRHLVPIFILFATRVASTLYLNIDTVLLGALVDDTSVGYYSAATKINTILITFFSAMAPVYIPRLTQYLTNDVKKYYKLLRKIFAIIILLALPMVAGIELLSRDIILIISGDNFLKASITVNIIAPVILLNALLEIIYYDIWVPLKKEKYILICTIISVVVNMSISLITIPYFHENGAAFGSLISELFTLTLAVILTFRIDRSFRCSAPNMFKYFVATFIMALVVISVKNLTLNTYLRCLLSIFTGGCVYFAVLTLMKDSYVVEILMIVKSKINLNSIKRG